jgi:hypothetical protein
MHEQYLKKDMFVRVDNFDIESKFKKGFEKDDMNVVITIEITIESMTIVSPIIAFEPKLVPHGLHLRIQFIFFKVRVLILLLT